MVLEFHVLFFMELEFLELELHKKHFKIFQWYSSSMNLSTMENLSSPNSSSQLVVDSYIFQKQWQIAKYFQKQQYLAILVNIMKSNVHQHGVWLGVRSSRIVLHNVWQELSNQSSDDLTNVLCQQCQPNQSLMVHMEQDYLTKQINQSKQHTII